jgi:acyl-CoA synthetase (AMP-forming)/AMP-acid ligase II
VLLPLQLTFIFGLWVTLLSLRAGAQVMLLPRFSADAFRAGLADRATVAAVVPTMLRTLFADAAPPEPALRMILTGGEPLGATLARRTMDSFPVAGIFDLYGLTETGACDFCLAPADYPEGAGAIGRPTAGVNFRILGEDGMVVADGEPGELRIKTPFGMLGYLDQPELTAASFDAEGHFKTGDLGRLRGDGRVELVGRSKDVISRGGNKIAPLEIDNLLCGHPGVAAALCAGVPDGRLGEAIHAVVVIKPGARLTVPELIAWASARTERFKVPDMIHIADALPVGGTGKASRAQVAAFSRNAGRRGNEPG